MKEIRIKICKDTRQVFLPKNFFAVNGENLQSKLIFEFTDEFVDGQARIEYQPLYGNKQYQWLTKENNTYTIPLKSALTGTTHIDLNLVITEGTDENEIPKFVSKMFYFDIDPAINAEIEQPDEYPTWIEMANTKLNQMDEALGEVDNLDIDVEKSETGTSTVTITKKDGTEKSVEIYDGNVQEIDMKEDKINKTTNIDGASTDIQYPSARCVFRKLEEHNESFASHLDIRESIRRKQDIVSTANLDNIPTFNTDGSIKDSGKAFTDFIEEIEIATNNIFNINTSENNKRINSSGDTESATGWITSSEILVESGVEYSIALINENGNILEGTIKFGYALYDLNHNLLGNYIYSSSSPTRINFEPPENTYLRFSIQKNDADGTNYSGYKLMVCEKSYIDNGGGYEEYQTLGTILYNKLPNLNQEEIDNNVLSKVDYIKHEITLENTDKIMIIGDSATASYYTIKDKAFISKISELSDYEFENYGVSGKTLVDGMERIINNTKLYNNYYGYQDIKPKYAMIMCYMNDIKDYTPNEYMENLSSMVDMVRKFGSEPIICTEHAYKYCDYDINMFTEISKRKKCKLMDIEKIVKQTQGANYSPHWGNNHPATRTNNLYSDNLSYYLDKLPAPTKSLKIYRLREGIDSSNLNNLYFNDRYKKIELFKEISTGHVCLSDYATGNYFDENGINPFVDNLDKPKLAKFNILDFEGVTVNVGDIYTTSNISGINFTVSIVENNCIYCSMSSTENDFSVEDGILINVEDNTKTLNYESGISISNSFSTINSEYLSLRHKDNIHFDKFFLVSATIPTKAQQTSYVGLYTYADRHLDIYVKGMQNYIEIESTDSNGYYAIPSEQLNSCIDNGKVNFLVKCKGEFNINDIKIIYSGTEEKQYKERDFVFEETLGKEYIETNTFENIIADEFWTKTGVITPLDANDSCYPSNATKIIKVNNENYISCNVNLDGGLFGKTYILDVYARYNPSSEKITYNSVDYKMLNVISKVLGTRPLTDGFEIYNKKEITGLHWKICRFEITAPSGTNDINLKILSSDETNIEIGKVSLKEAKLTDVPTEETVNEWGFTKNIGTITEITMNGTSKGTSGIVDLGTVITDISGKQDTIDSSHKLSADLVHDTSTTNKFVTASDKTTWNGKYTKPSGGIPDTDLSSAVQTSLGKADTALQSHQDISGKQDKLIAGTNITIASDGKTISATDTTYSDATTSTSGLMSSSDKTKLNGIATGATANTGTITSVKMNGSTISTSGEADLGTVITEHQDISGKLDTNKVKTTTSTTSGDVYDVTYINTMLGDIESLLSEV